MPKKIVSSPHFRTNAVFILALLMILTSVSADELLMRDGSRLKGEVIKRDNGTLHFKTTFAGTLAVQWTEIAELRTDKPMTFLLTDDSTLEATRIINSADEMILEDASAEAPKTLSQDVVAAINPAPWRMGKGRKFSGLVNFAFERQRGNTDDDELDWDGTITLRGKRDRFNAFGEYEKDMTNNSTTTKKWKLEGSYNYFVNEKWYTGAFFRFEHDRFADLDLRTSVGPLAGYQWFESRDLNLSTTTGLAYVDEDFSVAEDSRYVALPWSINFDKMLFRDVAQFYHKQIGFWNLESTSDVVWDTWTGLRFPLIMGLVASTELKVEYDSGSSEDAEDYDTTYSLKLGYEW